MAASDIQRVVSIIFAGEDRLSPAARAAQRTLSEFGTGLSGSVDALAGFTTGAARLEAGILATGAAAAVFAVNTAAKFDQSFRGLTTLIEEPTSALGGFRKAILDYAQGSTQPLEQITAALNSAIGSGIRWQDSLQLLGVAERGAVAGNALLSESTSLLVGTLNAYGLGVDQVQRVSDVFFRTVGDGTISIGHGYDEVLLAKIASSGSGSHRFALTADDAEATRVATEATVVYGALSADDRLGLADRAHHHARGSSDRGLRAMRVDLFAHSP